MALVLAVWGVVKLCFGFLKKVISMLSSLILFLGLYIPLFYLVFGLVLLATTSFTFGGTGTNQILYYVGLGLCCIASLIISIRNLIVRPFSSVFSAFRKEPEGDYDEGDYRRRRRRGRYDDEYDDDGYDYEPAPYRERPYGRYGANRYADPSGRPYPEYEYGGAGYPDERRMREGARYAEEREYRGAYGEARYAAPYRADYTDAPYAANRGERPLVYYSQRRPGVLVKEYSDRFELYTEDANGESHIGTEYKEE